VPLLGPLDAFQAAPRRVIVGGVSGSGKTTLAARVAEVISAPHVEIDGLFHGPRWGARPEFVADVERFSAGATWTTEWQYGAVRSLLLDRCDLLVWLDLPTHVVMRQVTGRTVRRRIRREVLWNGNVEPPFRTILTNREHIVRWAWSTRHLTRQRVSAALTARPDLPVVRLGSHGDGARWIQQVLRPVAGG
jgi:adenylate kinase family enzyme